MSLSHVRTTGRGLLALLCLCVFMQVLGVPTTLWSMELVNDLYEGSILNGDSITAWQVFLVRPTIERVSSDVRHPVPERLPDRALFRPPCLV